MLRRQNEETFIVRSSKVSQFIYLFSGGSKFTGELPVRHFYTPYVTDLFLLENPTIVKSLKEIAISVSSPISTL